VRSTVIDLMQMSGYQQTSWRDMSLVQVSLFVDDHFEKLQRYEMIIKTINMK